MNSSIDSRVRSSSPSSQSWFDRLLVKLHLTSSHSRKHVRNVLQVEALLADISRRCRSIDLHCSIKVDWGNERVFFERTDTVNRKSLRHEISFDELLSDNFNAQTFVSFRLSENNR